MLQIKQHIAPDKNTNHGHFGIERFEFCSGLMKVDELGFVCSCESCKEGSMQINAQCNVSLNIHYDGNRDASNQ